MPEDYFDALLEYMETELNFATSHYNDSYLDRRITARMRRTQTDDYASYLDLVKADDDEQEALLDSLSINVTGFFRNPDVWDGIAEVLEDLTGEHNSVDVWSAPCADGREPYSISMLAHDADAIDESAISILATDISEDALETARAGIYHESRTTDIADELSYLDDATQYIDHDEDEGSFEVSRQIKRPITFERHDLINGRPKSGFDLVICRNLFIYIDTEYKRQMLETIHESLRTDGYLVIGKSETIPPAMKSSFEPVHNRYRIYQKG